MSSYYKVSPSIDSYHVRYSGVSKCFHLMSLQVGTTITTKAEGAALPHHVLQLVCPH